MSTSPIFTKSAEIDELQQHEQINSMQSSACKTNEDYQSAPSSSCDALQLDSFELDIDALLAGEIDDSDHQQLDFDPEHANEFLQSSDTGSVSDTVRQSNMYFSVLSTQGNRSNMLDKFSSFIVHENLSFYAVFDGHGNDAIACYLEQYLLPLISAHPSFSFDVPTAITSTFQSLDALFQTEDQFMNSGCVCVCAIFIGDCLYIANLGDCRAVIYDKLGHTQQLSLDHSPSTRDDEVQRITNSNGVCLLKGSQLRVAGELNVTRAFGDCKYKPYVIAEPEVFVYSLQKLMEQFNFNEIFLVLATDGLWNDLDNGNMNRTARICAEGFANFPENSINQIIVEKECLRDNTTVLTVNLSLNYLASLGQLTQQVADGGDL